MSIRRCLVVVLLLRWLTATAVYAAPPTKGDEQRARALFKQAEVHFNVQEFERALELYTQAYKAKPLPGFLFNIGQCQRYLGKLKEALFSYRIYITRVPKGPDAAMVKRLIRKVEQQLASETSQPPQTRAMPQPMEPNTSQPASPSQPTAVAPRGDVALEEPAPRRARWIWIGLGAGLGAAFLATGLVTGQLASDRSGEYQDPATPLDRREDLKSSGERLRTTSIVTLALAGVSAIGTGVYAIVSARSARSTRSSARPGLRVSVLPAAGGVALGIGGDL